jgi:cysteine-rich repeat protein
VGPYNDLGIACFVVNRTLALSLALALWPAAALAVTPPATHRAGTGERELASGQVLRPVAPHEWRAKADPARARAWEALAGELGSAWATWDGDRPRQIVATGLVAPGTVASAAEAERVARAVLERHVELLAPGASASDFVVVANDLSGGIRSVGFSQRAAGRTVVGGQIGLSFAHDRLVLVTSTAKPYALVPAAAALVDHATARARARDFVRDGFSPAVVRTRGAVEGPLVLPVGDATTGPRYREVLRLDVESEAPLGRWHVYVDAETGEPVARESRMHYASGLVFYNVAERSPIFTRSDRPTPYTQHVVDGANQVSDAVGFVGFAGPTAAVQPGLSGPFIQMIDEAVPLASGLLVLADGGGVSWNVSGDPFLDAQLTTYAHLAHVKAYVRTLDPTLAWLDGTINAIVNIDDVCNAMSDGDSVYFFRQSPACENTGRMSDVVYHEFGHSVHWQSLIPGVGAFDGALSEGISDYLAATLVNDSGMARGFFYTEEPLRELDPVGYEWTWPQDNGEIHDAGRIIGGALWDLRTLLIAKYGVTEGQRRTDTIWYQATRRAVDMPSMYGAALLVNDDDGNLGNGTPDACEINAAFGAHGLYSGGAATAERVTATEQANGLRVHVDLSLPSFESCPLQATAELEWGPRDGGTTQSAAMIPLDAGYELVVPPLPPGQVMRYRVKVRYETGGERLVPANLGDPWLQHWFGDVEPIYCTSFADGTAAGWTIPPGWQVSPPLGLGGDPDAAAGPDPFVLGLDLVEDGLYRPFISETATSPTVAVPGGYESVRLHYWRWLTVEDGFYDQATILADGSPAWSNFASGWGGMANTHHRDAQWVFHDVDLTPWASDGQVTVSFTLASDGGLELGGWTIDELCVVGYRPSVAPPPACGNGLLEGAEECDDANTIAGDGCNASCQLEDGNGQTSDGGGDDGSASSDDGDEPGLGDDGRLVERGCACRAGRGNRGPLTLDALGLLALVLVGWRRRDPPRP